MKRFLSILNIEFLINEDAFKNWRMILFLSFLAVIMIASGHSADRKIFKIALLNTELQALKSEFVDTKRVLLNVKKETSIIGVLNEKGVGPATTPPIKIIVANGE